MYAKTRSPRISQRRGAFTLVELMIVIVIIAILMSFLLVGVNGALKSARRVTCTVEISNLDNAVNEFQREYGVAPPSFIILYETGEGTGGMPPDPSWGVDTSTPFAVASGNVDQYRRLSRSAIRSIWPQYNFVQDVDINGDGDTTDVFILNGAECLAFFLGGVDDRGATTTNDHGVNWQPTGFAANPQTPFAPSTVVSNRRGPFMENLDGNRFVDSDGDGFPEYLDALPDQTQPLQYFSSYDGTGYRPRGIDGVAGNSDDESSVATFVSHYIKANGAGSGADPAPTSPSTSWNPKSFQIISAGFDFEFGSGGIYQEDGSFPSAGSETYASSVVRDTAHESDNITNFKGGELN
ncbi:MAG: type II secretion system protein [Planctomycetaceae bacterium]|nr:type II secretion system protein [Planctomycetaceae bacterium]